MGVMSAPWPPLNEATRYPYGYSTATKTLAETKDWLMKHHHPEYVRRLCWWLYRQGGKVGCGGGWRAGGAQPDKPGFAPEGKSFHQDQNYNDGFTGACAVDLVVKNPGKIHRAPYWSEVPPQGSQAARDAGVHCNVGAPPGGESWHIQPVEIDGWQSWWNAGRPHPVPNYPIKGTAVTLPPVLPDLGDDDMAYTGHDPVRIEDTRPNNGGDGKVGAKKSITITPHGLTPEPSPDEDVYVVVNFTVFQAEGPGYITAWSGEGSVPNASIVNYSPADPSPKNGFGIIKLNPNGDFKVYTLAKTHVVVDQAGFFTKKV